MALALLWVMAWARLPTTPTSPVSRPGSAGSSVFDARADAVLAGLRAGGQYKHLQILEGTMGPTVKVKGYGECLCFCSNNYLGLADHPEVVEAGLKGLR